MAGAALLVQIDPVQPIAHGRHLGDKQAVPLVLAVGAAGADGLDGRFHVAFVGGVFHRAVDLNLRLRHERMGIEHDHGRAQAVQLPEAEMALLAAQPSGNAADRVHGP